jgi:hypothetical protein
MAKIQELKEGEELAALMPVGVRIHSGPAGKSWRYVALVDDQSKGDDALRMLPKSAYKPDKTTVENIRDFAATRGLAELDPNSADWFSCLKEERGLHGPSSLSTHRLPTFVTLGFGTN